ncbi:MAG: HIT domain-containing protein [Candidatus Eisenbacteria sp.]|nr:HIT domain-containing protein [Candidatus Eisenbacteria bacterium]
MDRLWAIWRMAYIEQPKEEGCLFCRVGGAEADGENYVLWRGSSCFVMLNAFPYNTGHLLVSPYRHVGHLSEVTAEEAVEWIAATGRCKDILRRVMRAEGFNVGLNVGLCAGAGVEGHLHFHIVPRWNGDTNFMPVLADHKVLPEGLKATYEKLIGEFRNLSLAEPDAGTP